MKVETEGLLTIGRFARWSGLTVKALRHYDDVGLLRPAHVDDWTGYRWYERSQIADALAIRRLRTLRVPLDEIAELIHADEATLREALEVHRARLEGELVETRQILGELDRLIEGKEQLVSELTLDLTLVDEPGGRYVVHGERVRVDDMFTFVPETCTRVIRWLEEQGIPCLGPPLAIFLGNGVDEWLDVEVGVPIEDREVRPADGISLRELPPTRGAEHVHHGAYEALPEVYRALEAAIRSRGLEPRDLAREHYLVNPGTSADPDAYVTRIVWPVASG
jgi:DNA-binding transcriptional MerR regulator/effector-binding domain-containing protein